MKNRSLVLTVSLIAMMIVGAAHGAQIASTDYVKESVGDEADLVWDSFDKLHAGLGTVRDETTGAITSFGAIDAAVDAANKHTDDEITAAMEEVADAIPTKVSDLPNDAGFITAASVPTRVGELTNDTGFITSADIPTVDDALSDTSTNAVQNKVVTAALASKADASALSGYATNQALTDGLAEKLGKNEKAASATTADSATSATQDASGNVITETYATKTELGGKMDKVTLATVATSGSYNDLSDKPTVDDALSDASTNAVQNKVVTAALASKADASALSGYATNQALTDGLAEKLDKTGSIEITQVTGLSDALANAGAEPDAELSTTSENSVQNKIVTAALNEKLGKNEKAASATTADSATSATQDASGNVITETYATKTELGGKMDKVTLATVATSGNYSDLSGQPTIPTNNNQLTNGAGYITAASLPTVDATLSDTSTNAVQNKVVTAALASKADASAIPTNNNQLTNGAGYITAASLPGAATASAAGIMKWGQIPSGSATATTSATIWVQ